uniref:Uncharacterized protein n=1 Tax=Arundo donax TaxID=35708 RepID=A0A0A8Y149_ARUDO
MQNMYQIQCSNQPMFKSTKTKCSECRTSSTILVVI